MIKPGKLILIRHAPVKRKEGFLPEHNPDAIINKDEFKNLSRNIPEDSVWHVSPLRRTMQTADGLSKYVRNRKTIIDSNLVEQNFGSWSGMRISEVWKELRDNESQHNFSFLCPEISSPNGDSFLDQCKRISSWIENLNFHESQVIVAITHSGTIRAALSYMLGIEPDKAVGIEIFPLSLSLFEVLNEEDSPYRGGRFRLLGVNK